MKIINISDEQLHQIDAEEQCEISLVQSNVVNGDTIIFKGCNNYIVTAYVNNVRTRSLCDITPDEIYSEGIRVSVPSILKGEPKVPDGFEQLTEERQEAFWLDTARAVYIAQIDLRNSLYKEYAKRWDECNKELHEKYKWNNNPTVFVIEFEKA